MPGAIIQTHRYKCPPLRLIVANTLQEDRLGISILPSQVRLITNGDDPYTWEALPEKKHLFSKNISDHSIGAYKELCEGLGVWFEAVPATAKRKRSMGDPKEETLNLCISEPHVSFSAKIEELQGEVARLRRELFQWKEQANTALESRRQTEGEFNQLIETNNRLKQEAQKNAIMAKHFRNSTSKYALGVKRILPLLEELKTDLPPVEGDSVIIN